jgi:hypothetical protein
MTSSRLNIGDFVKVTKYPTIDYFIVIGFSGEGIVNLRASLTSSQPGRLIALKISELEVISCSHERLSSSNREKKDVC